MSNKFIVYLQSYSHLSSYQHQTLEYFTSQVLRLCTTMPNIEILFDRILPKIHTNYMIHLCNWILKFLALDVC